MKLVELHEAGSRIIETNSMKTIKIVEANSMKTNMKSFLYCVLTDQSGQVTGPVTIFLLIAAVTVLIGVGGLSVDVGHAYIVRSQLQGAANAAALAAVGDLYTSVNTVSAASTTLTNDALAYSASTGGANYNASLPTVTTTVTTPCITALMPTTTCDKSGNIPNAVKVKETASVPTLFIKLLGVSSLKVGATATAAPKGTNNETLHHGDELRAQ
jgi:Flp pilus assembly protein TadG